jgi:hypothetical protein
MHSVSSICRFTRELHGTLLEPSLADDGTGSSWAQRLLLATQLRFAMVQYTMTK